MARLTLATYPDRAGKTLLVNVGTVTHYVECVPYGTASDIVFQEYTVGYARMNSRPYVTKRAGYASLGSAVKALIKEAA